MENSSHTPTFTPAPEGESSEVIPGGTDRLNRPARAHRPTQQLMSRLEWRMRNLGESEDQAQKGLALVEAERKSIFIPDVE